VGGKFAKVDEDCVEDAFAEVDADEDCFLVNKVFSAPFKSTFSVEDKFEDEDGVGGRVVKEAEAEDADEDEGVGKDATEDALCPAFPFSSL
jgi:hypothetical protein